MSSLLILGTRGSALARWQASHTQALLQAAGHAVAIEEFTTKGDRVLDVPLAEIGDKGLFTQELDAALLAGEIHLAVHSLKDLPTTLPEGLVLAAITERAAPWDAFVAHPRFEGQLSDLPEGATLATSSLRRKAQLLAWRPDLHIIPVRGNVDTRLRKLDASDWHGVILAEAGLGRLGLQKRIRQRFPLDIMIPAVSQGALGVVCAASDTATRDVLHDTLNHVITRATSTAERAFLRRLEGGCQAPIGAYAHVDAEHQLSLHGCVASLDGSVLIREQIVGGMANAEVLGTALAERILEQGAAVVLSNIRQAKG
ncbi:MAG TPA: hydroxymethylbilane synthase [Rhodothermales bacterium]|nr:hydroxymethylbilane synthase [Rhodothermales bacterium]